MNFVGLFYKSRLFLSEGIERSLCYSRWISWIYAWSYAIRIFFVL